MHVWVPKYYSHIEKLFCYNIFNNKFSVFSKQVSYKHILSVCLHSITTCVSNVYVFDWLLRTIYNPTKNAKIYILMHLRYSHSHFEHTYHMFDKMFHSVFPQFKFASQFQLPLVISFCLMCIQASQTINIIGNLVHQNILSSKPKLLHQNIQQSSYIRMC